MRNVKTGINPSTGKEYFLINVSPSKVLSYSGESFQTRYGAEQNKKSSQIILKKDALAEKIEIWKRQTKKLQNEVQRLESQLMAIKANPETSENQIKRVQEDLRQARLSKAYDYSNLLKTEPA